MQINVTLSALANLLAQINADNASLNLTSAQVTFGAPAARTPDANPNNTTIVATAVAGQGFTGTKTLTYTRLGMDSGVAVAVSTVNAATDDTQATALTKVATALGLVEAELDASAFTAPVDASTPGTLTIAPKADSLLYVGASKTVSLVIAQDLGTAIATADLNGFTAVA